MSPLHSNRVALALLVAGVVVRLWMAYAFFLNADEALHYLLASEPTLGKVYAISLGTAHPPLFLLLLHCWQWFGHSEFAARLLSVLASAAFAWVSFLWLRRQTDPGTALIGLFLFLFAPPLIWLSAEVRQYAVLWFFAIGSLYFFERGIDENSIGLMLLSALSLDLALLTHYSALVFAVATGIYGLIRLWLSRPRPAITATWVGGQVLALAVVGFLARTQLRQLRAERKPETWGEQYLKGSIFHPGEEGVVHFVWRANIRFFHYLFAQGAVGVAALLLFVVGVILLVRAGGCDPEGRKRKRGLACLLILPFVVNCGLGLAGVFPYGGTRHNSILAIFAMPAIAIAIAEWRIPIGWLKPALLAAVLLICNLFPAPLDSHIKPRNHDRKLMAEAVSSLTRLAPPDSIIFTDQQGRLLLNYYLCREDPAHVPTPMPEFLDANCGGYRLLSINPSIYGFNPATFPAVILDLRESFHLRSDQAVLFFQGGWIYDKGGAMRARLAQYGCDRPREFGQNLFVCTMALESKTEAAAAQ